MVGQGFVYIKRIRQSAWGLFDPLKADASKYRIFSEFNVINQSLSSQSNNNRESFDFKPVQQFRVSN
jgi:hypothetical protein